MANQENAWSTASRLISDRRFIIGIHARRLSTGSDTGADRVGTVVQNGAIVTHNREVTTMTEPQVWTLIGVFAAIMLGGMTLMTTLLSRVVMTTVGGLRAEMGARFDAVDTRIDHLDRDVAAVARHVFGER